MTDSPRISPGSADWSVEIWNGDRKVTIHKDAVIRIWGINIDTEMSEKPRTLETMQAAMDWLYRTPAQRVPVTDGTYKEGDVLSYEMDETTRVGLVTSHTRAAAPQCTCGRPLECPECMSLRTEPQASQIVAYRWRLKGNTDWWTGEKVPTAIFSNGNWEIEPLGVVQPQAALRQLFADHYWDTFHADRDLIMKHIDAVLALSRAQPQGAEVTDTMIEAAKPSDNAWLKAKIRLSICTERGMTPWEAFEDAATLLLSLIRRNNDSDDPPMIWLIERLRGLATDLVADELTPWIGERDPKQHICWTAADRLAALSRPTQPSVEKTDGSQS